MTPEHRERTALLDSLATLAGFHSLLPAFADGRTPDVLRLDLRRGGLFVGDAKAQDGPRTAESYLRVRRYVAWASAHLSRPDRRLVLALAVPHERSADWATLLDVLVEDVGVTVTTRERIVFGSTEVIAFHASSALRHAA